MHKTQLPLFPQNKFRMTSPLVSQIQQGTKTSLLLKTVHFLRHQILR